METKKLEAKMTRNLKNVIRIELSQVDNVSQFGMKRTESWPDYKPRA